MGKQSIFKKILTVLSLTVFLSAGYLAMSVVTSHPAKADCVPVFCIMSNTLSNEIKVIGKSIKAAIEEAQAQIIANFTVAIADYTRKVNDKIDDVTENVTNWFDTFWNFNQKPSKQAMTDQLSAMNADQSRELSSFTDAANQNRTSKEFEDQQIKSHREQRPDENGCITATVAGGMTRAFRTAVAYNAAAPAEKLPRSGNSVGTAAAAGPAADMKERWDTYTARYCNKDDNNGHSGCTSSGAFVGQDTDVTGTIFSKETIDLKNPDTKQTVDDLITNVAEPFVKDTVPPGAVKSSPGQGAILAGQSYKARRQTIYDSLYHIVSRRAPGSSMQDFVKPLRQAAGLPDSMISNNPSHNEIMQVMMSERFRSGTYSIEQIDEPENNQREMVIQQAFQLMQLSDQLDLMDRYSLLLAAQASAEIKGSKHFGSAMAGAPME